MSDPRTLTDKLIFRLQQGATFVFLLYVLFLLGRSAWTNIQTNRKIAALRDQIASLKQENARLANLIVYEQTDSFRELEARRKLGIKKPGELVLVLPPEPIAQTSPKKPSAEKPVPASTGVLLTAWWQYFFG